MPTYQAKYPIVLFDGICGMCHTFVKTIIALDKNAKFSFAPIDSDIGREILRERSAAPADGTSMILVTEDGIFQKSDAPLNVFKILGGIFSVAAKVALIAPKELRDFIYGIIARNRYKIAGKFNECPIPEPHLKNRFLF